MRCVAFCTARYYQLSAIASYFKAKQCTVKTYKDVVHVNDKTKHDIFFFNLGCFITWGLSKAEEHQLAEQIKQFAIEPLDHSEKDYFIYQLGEETDIATHERFNIDIITLESDNPQLKLAISYGITQSVKLESYEEMIHKTISANQHIPQELVENGKIRLSRHAISKRIGDIFMQRNYINLNSEFLDIPEHFWRYPSMESYYEMTEKFLDIPRRVSSLNQKLDILHETFDMLNNELHHRHTSFLEWIIIILIFSEIVLNILHKI